MYMIFPLWKSVAIKINQLQKCQYVKKCTEKNNKINTLKNKSKIIEIPVNYRYVNQKCENSYVAVYP